TRILPEMIYLVYGVTFGLAATVQPGPFLTFIISQTLRNGWRKTLPASFAPLLTDGPIAVVAILVLSHLPPVWLQWLRIAGGVFIIYLSWNAFKAWKNYSFTVDIQVVSGKKSLIQASVVNALNPGPYLGWSLVMGPILIKGWGESSLNGIALIAGFYGTMVTTLSGIILLFHFARNMGSKVNRAMIGLSSLALAIFGIYQLIIGLNNILLPA
ncbi:LysE family transporter, partial [Dolichospermum sp. ST_sed3]|nr:LysE family transporter [Dolichospermum sp. ST_sed3]